jgi:1-deoxy-D-xylulose 5-phosphate reductoisomerase
MCVFPFLFVRQSGKWQNIKVKGKQDMTNKDKVIAAFLVSIGIFSTTQAVRYVKTLEANEKNSMISVAKLSNSGIVLCEDNTSRAGLQNKNNG